MFILDPFGLGGVRRRADMGGAGADIERVDGKAAVPQVSQAAGDEREGARSAERSAGQAEQASLLSNSRCCHTDASQSVN